MSTKFDGKKDIKWYRTPVDREVLSDLNRRSDLRGLAQAGGHLALIVVTGASCIYAALAGWWLLLVPLLFLHGTVCAFMTNAEHELVHGTVFRSAWLNALFLRIFGFLRWFPYDFYWASHTEHHKYTLHPPLDREVVLPTRHTWSEFLRTGFIDPARLVEMLRTHLRLARGRLEGEWETYLLAADPVRHNVFRWSRILLVGHLAIAVVSIYYGYWIVPVVVSLTPCYGGWLLYLCNNTQHAGLVDRVSDFRLNCRTMYLNPVVEFLYWRMNFHTEHHMYAAVPCYNLSRLHQAIRHDLPPASRGLLATWRQIAEIQRRQAEDPDYRFMPQLPENRQTPAAAPEDGSQAAGTGADNTEEGRGADRVWECSVCGFVYSERLGLPEEGIPPGTAWEDIPDDWACPDCGTGKADFDMVEVS